MNIIDLRYPFNIYITQSLKSRDEPKILKLYYQSMKKNE